MGRIGPDFLASAFEPPPAPTPPTAADVERKFFAESAVAARRLLTLDYEMALTAWRDDVWEAWGEWEFFGNRDDFDDWYFDHRPDTRPAERALEGLCRLFPAEARKVEQDVVRERRVWRNCEDAWRLEVKHWQRIGSSAPAVVPVHHGRRRSHANQQGHRRRTRSSRAGLSRSTDDDPHEPDDIAGRAA